MRPSVSKQGGTSPAIGILALQGDIAAHGAMLRGLGVTAREIRHAEELEALQQHLPCGLILPGGESTALLRLMEHEPWFEAITAFHQSGAAILATCAGTILLANGVAPPQASLGLVDCDVARNAWGRQVCSFTTDLEVEGLEQPLHVAFIRAPRITRVGPRVEVLARYRGEPVLVRQDRILAATFHPEIAGSNGLHAHFLELAAAVPSTTSNSLRAGPVPVGS